MDQTLQMYIDKLNKLNFKEMYENDFFLTWDKTDDEIEAVFTVADALRYMREHNISTKIFESGLGISLFRDNSTRTRFSFASACNLLGLEVQDLDEKKSQIAHGETVRETANMVSFMADVIGIRDDMFIGEGHKYQKTFMDAVKEGYANGVSIMGRNGIPVIGFGPGAEAQAHAPNEITWKQDLATCAAVYAALPGCYCGE